ncbi:MAG: DNA/RNA non-specific endonuclease [Burkholderiales bacterium]
MGVILDQIAKAQARATEVDLATLVTTARTKVPRDLADAKQLGERRRFLMEQFADSEEANSVFERIIGGNEIQDVNFLGRGEIAARSIARIEIRSPSGRLEGYGTGFLIAPRVLLTNHHVLPDARAAERSIAQFDYERDVSGSLKPVAAFELAPADLFHSLEKLDFAVVAVKERSIDAARPIHEFGSLPLVGRVGKVAEGEWLTIIQHPGGELKQLCTRENKLLKRAQDVLWYSTDTLGGSSGSPVFNNDWYVVALHHSGVPKRRGDVILNVDGTDYDPRTDPEGRNIQWEANEGIRVSRIVEHLSAALPDHPLVKTVLAEGIDAFSLAKRPSTSDIQANKPSTILQSTRSIAMSTPSVSPKRVTVTIAIDENGRAELVGSGQAPLESFSFAEAARSSSARAKYDVPFNNDYSTRKGYRADFLGTGNEVNLPTLSPALKKAASKLLDADGKPTTDVVLDYHNYSLVMHAERRFAIYTAANVRADQRYEVSRPTDVWRTDPRIPIEHQVTDFYYKSNQLDRGHLTRREDLEFGKSLKEALASAADTCHWTNCTPQHSKFNQNKELWQGIERYLLEQSIWEGQYNTQVITGPILDEDDPVYERHPEIQYPVRFWKVVATLDGSGKLFATAYLLDQSDVIAQFGIEATAPFGAYKTFQVPIAEIERLTGLQFTYGKGKKDLKDVDPLASATLRPRGRRTRLHESVAIGSFPEGYAPLSDVSDIIVA